tara:strand:- start:212 stop:784 length:573 start_codon:yes stop_codon:yes gene_type:complete
MNDLNDKINMDELYKQRKITEEHKIKIYQKILARVHSKIKIVARTRNNKRFCFFLLPEFVLGIPRYNIEICTSYVITKLLENGFKIKYTYPNLLFISWSHYIPNYERAKIKKLTGINVDGFGNIIKKKAEKTTDSSNMNNLLLKNKKINIKKSDINKQYKSVDTYKPTGNLIYNDSLLAKMRNIMPEKNN